MKLFFEFFPIILFFGAYKLKGIFFATAIAIIASLCQVIYSYARKRKVEPMMWISLVVLVVFGGSTLLLHNEMFIKWKPTVLYGIFSITLLTSELIFKKNLIRAMLQRQISLPDQVWRRLNIAWAAFFAVLGVVNVLVAYHYSTATWVNFKLFGILGCMLIFVIVQSLFLAPYSEHKVIQSDAPSRNSDHPLI